MLALSSRNQTPLTSHRTSRPATSKIIFLSCEGSVTEEQYFRMLSDLYGEVRTRIQFISVAEDAVRTPHQRRTPEQVALLSRVRPLQLVQRIDHFKDENEERFQFSEYPEDEFWVVTDVDKNWSDEIINMQEHKSYRDEWNDAVKACGEKGYHYAVSNPFFEAWLLLHHDEPTEEDRAFAVTPTHPYAPTNHFKTRLSELGAPLRDKKHIRPEDYSRDKVVQAVQRAKQLHLSAEDLAPQYFSTTVYLLVDKILALAAEQEEEETSPDPAPSAR